MPMGRQVKTDAHPLVEMTLMDQPARRRTLVHLVNGTGHSGTAYFPPVELRDIRIELARPFQRATAVGLNKSLSVTTDGRSGAFTLPTLKAYDVIIIE